MLKVVAVYVYPLCPILCVWRTINLKFFFWISRLRLGSFKSSGKENPTFSYILCDPTSWVQKLIWIKLPYPRSIKLISNLYKLYWTKINPLIFLRLNYIKIYLKRSNALAGFYTFKDGIGANDISYFPVL